MGDAGLATEKSSEGNEQTERKESQMPEDFPLESGDRRSISNDSQDNIQLNIKGSGPAENNDDANGTKQLSANTGEISAERLLAENDGYCNVDKGEVPKICLGDKNGQVYFENDVHEQNDLSKVNEL